MSGGYAISGLGLGSYSTPMCDFNTWLQNYYPMYAPMYNAQLGAGNLPTVNATTPNFKGLTSTPSTGQTTENNGISAGTIVAGVGAATLIAAGIITHKGGGIIKGIRERKVGENFKNCLEKIKNIFKHSDEATGAATEATSTGSVPKIFRAGKVDGKVVVELPEGTRYVQKADLASLGISERNAKITDKGVNIIDYVVKDGDNLVYIKNHKPEGYLKQNKSTGKWEVTQDGFAAVANPIGEAEIAFKKKLDKIIANVKDKKDKGGLDDILDAHYSIERDGVTYLFGHNSRSDMATAKSWSDGLYGARTNRYLSDEDEVVTYLESRTSQKNLVETLKKGDDTKDLKTNSGVFITPENLKFYVRNGKIVEIVTKKNADFLEGTEEFNNFVNDKANKDIIESVLKRTDEYKEQFYVV